MTPEERYKDFFSTTMQGGDGESEFTFHVRAAVQAEQSRQESRQNSGIARILEKCEQYWNESNICDAEVHAVLEFIHREAQAIRARTVKGETKDQIRAREDMERREKMEKRPGIHDFPFSPPKGEE